MPFTVYETESYRVDHCRAYQEQEARGIFGCHQYATCPECRVTFDCVEYWGENGHRQASLSTRVDAEYARQCDWNVKPGGRSYYVGRML